MLKEENKKKSLEGMKRKLTQQQQSEENFVVEDDVQYFREETGVEPDEGKLSS